MRPMCVNACVSGGGCCICSDTDVCFPPHYVALVHGCMQNIRPCFGIQYHELVPCFEHVCVDNESTAAMGWGFFDSLRTLEAGSKTTLTMYWDTHHWDSVCLFNWNCDSMGIFCQRRLFIIIILLKEFIEAIFLDLAAHGAYMTRVWLPKYQYHISNDGTSNVANPVTRFISPNLLQVDKPSWIIVHY